VDIEQSSECPNCGNTCYITYKTSGRDGISRVRNHVCELPPYVKNNKELAKQYKTCGAVFRTEASVTSVLVCDKQTLQSHWVGVGEFLDKYAPLGVNNFSPPKQGDLFND